jgi:hypothetical protein
MELIIRKGTSQYDTEIPGAQAELRPASNDLLSTSIPDRQPNVPHSGFASVSRVPGKRVRWSATVTVRREVAELRVR